MKSLDFSRQFLGPHDADDDKNLRNYYVQFGDFSAIFEHLQETTLGNLKDPCRLCQCVIVPCRHCPYFIPETVFPLTLYSEQHTKDLLAPLGFQVLCQRIPNHLLQEPGEQPEWASTRRCSTPTRGSS
jgi:hypothetical protein